MQQERKVSLGLIFTRKISIAFWERVGNLDREIIYYNNLAQSCEKIYFFTHGTRDDDARFQPMLPANIRLFYRPRMIPTSLYVLLMPFVHHRAFRAVDIIKTNQMDSSWSGVIAKWLYKKKLIVRCGYEWLDFITRNKRGALKIWIAKTVERISYRAADRIIITSEADKRFIATTFGIDPEKITVIANYIDIDRFKPLGLPKEAGRVLFVGRLEPQKNIASLVEALEGLPAHLVIAGSGSLKADAVTASERTGVRLKFLGNVPQEQLPTEYDKSEIYALSSLHEGNPKSLLEAMAVGVACVGADSKGIRGVIRDGETGLLATPTPEGLHRAIKSLLENPDLRAKLGRNAREEIAQKQSLPATIVRELAVYKILFP